VRIGVGLFGARGGEHGPALVCALRLSAPVVSAIPSHAVESSGYGEARTFERPWLATVRCGYADGFPKRFDASTDIVSVGMQYTVLQRPGHGETRMALIDAATDLDSFCTSAGTAPHEVVVGIGRARTQR
jgi:alanine racemase